MNRIVTTSSMTFEKFLKNLLKIILFPSKKLLKVFDLSGFSIMLGANPIFMVFSIEVIMIKNNDVKNSPNIILKIEFVSLKYRISVSNFNAKKGIEIMHLTNANLKLCLKFEIKFLV